MFRILCLAVLACRVSAAGDERVLLSWRFDQPGRLDGWQPNGHLKDTRVADGALHTRAVDWDPFLTSPVFDIPARPWQCIEFRIKATKPGKGQIFWTNTLKTKYAGFSPHKNTPFALRGDGRWETVRVYPFWQGEKKIIRLRFDVYDGAEFDVDYIRVVDLAPQARAETSWDFQQGLQGWRAMDAGCGVRWADGKLLARMNSEDGRLLAPGLRVDVNQRLWVHLHMKVTAPPGPALPQVAGRIWCANAKRSGLGKVSFNVRPDGRFRHYNIDMTPSRYWGGELLALAVTPAACKGAEVEIDDIEIVEDPMGPAQVEVKHFVLMDTAPRAGQDVRVAVVLENTGARAAEGLRARLRLPAGVSAKPGEQALPAVEPDDMQQITWTLRAARPGRVTVRLDIQGVCAPPPPLTIDFAKPLRMPKATYVPEPKPVKSRYDIGVFYFPGWCSAARWDPIRRVAPQRKPALGWYDEANPECADWQIKWAVEHGVKFFMVDWYWNRGGRHLDHWINHAYLRARYRKYLKFCVMWANHNPPGSHSVEDWRKVTQYWIDHYFHMKEYYRIDDRPAVYIWTPWRVRRDVGGSETVAKMLALSQKMARAAGYKGVYFVAMSDHRTPAACERLKKEGYEAFTSYHGFGPAMRRAGRKVFPYDLVVETGPEVWNDAARRASGLRYFPIVDTGWSSEPWHGARARVIYGFSGAKFGALCRAARAWADARGERIISIGPWNEWGEGSYIEPCAEFGFAPLDALRAAFCEPGPYPPNLTPRDVGLGPYDLPMQIAPRKTAWTFDQDREGWGLGMGLQWLPAKPGLLRAKSVSHDPAFLAPPLRLRARKWRSLLIRMRVTGAKPGDQCQVFWATRTMRTCEAASVRLPLVVGRFHDYRFALSKNRRWHGVITKLRFDPCSTQDAVIEIDSARFER